MDHDRKRLTMLFAGALPALLLATTAPALSFNPVPAVTPPVALPALPPPVALPALPPPVALPALPPPVALPAVPPPVGPAPVDVPADAETPPVLHGSDAADDPAIWVNETNPGDFAVIGTDREGALEVYDSAGLLLQRIEGVTPNNVDLRKGFLLGGKQVDLVGASDWDLGGGVLRFWTIDAATRQLTSVSPAAGVKFGAASYGFCMYRSPATGKFYAFSQDKIDGTVEQVELFDQAGMVGGRVVRTLQVGGNTEGCVADDELGDFYIGAENDGIWRYGAEPGDSPELRTLVDTAGPGKHLSMVEGLAIVRQPGGTGYLLASSQGDDEYAVYRREGANEFIRMVRVVDGASSDGCSHTDGIDAVAADLGPSFPSGLFVCQDNDNTIPGSLGHQNFKYVRLERMVPLAPGQDPAYPPVATHGDLDRGGANDRVTPDGTAPAYRIASADGSTFLFENGELKASTASLGLNRPIVGMAQAPSGSGHWMVASDGGIFAFGDAGFFGSTGDIKLAKPIVGMTATATGKGYWMVASDGGIFAFGDAAFGGSAGWLPLTAPVIAMTRE
jgi:3-phytase